MSLVKRLSFILFQNISYPNVLYAIYLALNIDSIVFLQEGLLQFKEVKMSSLVWTTTMEVVKGEEGA